MVKRPSVLDNWEEIQHDPLSLPPDNFAGLSLEDAVASIRDWFFENFEDPAVSTPYESREGGYQYIWGGPYNTRDIVENVFADTASDAIIRAAIEDLEVEGYEWVPSSNRRQPPDEEYEPFSQADPSALHERMMQEAQALEDIVFHLPVQPSGIGHNNPPEPIDDIPFTEEDRASVLDALEVLRNQPVEPPDKGAAATEAIVQLEKTGGRFRDWLARQGDTFVSEAAREAGKEFGKWAPRALIAVFIERVFGLAATARGWMEAIGAGLPF